MSYDGPVCYQDGWHYTVVTDDEGDHPGERLFLDDDGTYRAVENGDASWFDRKHRGYTLVVPEGGTPAVAVTATELADVQAFLEQQREGA